MWTILVLSTSVILFAHADRILGRHHQQQSFLKRGPSNAGQDTGTKAKAIKLKREEHLVGDLPWAEGQEPITSYAGHIPIRNWHQSGYRGETGMYVFLSLPCPWEWNVAVKERVISYFGEDSIVPDANKKQHDVYFCSLVCSYEHDIRFYWYFPAVKPQVPNPPLIL